MLILSFVGRDPPPTSMARRLQCAASRRYSAVGTDSFLCITLRESRQTIANSAAPENVPCGCDVRRFRITMRYEGAYMARARQDCPAGLIVAAEELPLLVRLQNFDFLFSVNRYARFAD
jgi:hypothetical protein